MLKKPNKLTFTRREVLAGAAAGAASLAMPTILRADSHTRWVRHSMTSPEGVDHLKIYRKAVEVMWALPPTDPHNYFRYAMIHLMDCPHGNWWFFSWHRPYVANLEQIVRIYGEDDRFAMPYWDWSVDPYVAPTMFQSEQYPDNALDPTSSHYPDWNTFENTYYDPIKAFWQNLTREQRKQEALRGFSDFDTFWNQGVTANFTQDPQYGRSKTPSSPNLTGRAARYVQPNVIDLGLKPEKFTTVVSGNDAKTGFNSPEANNHHAGVGSAILEGYPHNNVHNNLGNNNGGWMPSLLSSVDPIFFLHHCNVDRLWDVWSQKQTQNGLSDQPTPQEQPTFYPEKYLFYVNSAGQTVPSTAKEAMPIDPWGYSYTPGTGSEIIQQAPTLLSAPDVRVNAQSSEAFSPSHVGTASLVLPKAFTDEALKDEPRQIAHVTITPPMMLKGTRFDFFLSAAGQDMALSIKEMIYAGSYEFFGMVHSHGHDFTVTVDVTDAFNTLIESGDLDKGQGVNVSVALGSDTPEQTLLHTGLKHETDKTLDPAMPAEKMMQLEGVLKSVTLETI